MIASNVSANSRISLVSFTEIFKLCYFGSKIVVEWSLRCNSPFGSYIKLFINFTSYRKRHTLFRSLYGVNLFWSYRIKRIISLSKPISLHWIFRYPLTQIFFGFSFRIVTLAIMLFRKNTQSLLDFIWAVLNYLQLFWNNGKISSFGSLWRRYAILLKRWTSQRKILRKRTGIIWIVFKLKRIEMLDSFL